MLRQTIYIAMTDKMQDTNNVNINNYSESMAKALSVEEIEQRKPIGLVHMADWDRAILDMGKTYSYIANSCTVSGGARWYEFWNGRYWVRVALMAGTTVVDGVALCVAAPFAVVGAITRGTSELSKKFRKWCFKDMGFDSFSQGVATILSAPIGALAWVFEKVTKYVSKAFMFIANAPLNLANFTNRKIVGLGDQATKSDTLVKQTKNHFRKFVREQKIQKAKMEIIGRSMDSKREEIKNLSDSIEKFDDVELENPKVYRLCEDMRARCDTLEAQLREQGSKFADCENRFNMAKERIKQCNSKAKKTLESGVNKQNNTQRSRS